MKTYYWGLLFGVILVGITFSTTQSFSASSPGNPEIIFVKQVPKTCTHLGSIEEDLDPDDLVYESWPNMSNVKRGGDLFVGSMKKKAKALGANRLVVADIFHDKTITSGPRTGYGESIDATHIRVRAFRCS